MSLRLAVFDVDGTLVDSRQNIHRAACESAADLGLPEPSYDKVRQIVGLSLREALGVMEPGLDQSGLDQFVAGFQASFTRMHNAPGYREPLYDGAQEMLERLHRDGWKIAMATGNSRKGVGRLLTNHRWADYFVSTHCADDGPGKPHPAMLIEAMKASGAEPSQTVMIGDTSHDMRMAVAAKVYGQGVAWGFHTADEVLASGAGHVAETFEDLQAQLDGFAARITGARRAG